MAIVKAKYLEALDKDTNQIVQVQMIPPEPDGSDLGGVTKEEKQKFHRNMARARKENYLKQCQKS